MLANLAGDLKDEEEWKQVPSQRGRSILSWHTSPSQVPFQNRYGAMELDNITSPESLPQGWSGAGVVRQEGKRGERVRRKRARERKRGKDLIWFL